MQDMRPMTPEEILRDIENVADVGHDGSLYVHTEWLRTSLRALLLQVGEEIEKERTENADQSSGVDDCKRVIDKVISEI